MKPEPSEVALRFSASAAAAAAAAAALVSSKKSLKNSSNGEPGGNCGSSGAPRSFFCSGFSVWVVEMLTTDGSSFAARSAKPSGAGRAAASPAGTTKSSAANTATAERRRLDENSDTVRNSLNTTSKAGRIGRRAPRASQPPRIREKRAASQMPSRRDCIAVARAS